MENTDSLSRPLRTSLKPCALWKVRFLRLRLRLMTYTNAHMTEANTATQQSAACFSAVTRSENDLSRNVTEKSYVVCPVFFPSLIFPQTDTQHKPHTLYIKHTPANIHTCIYMYILSIVCYVLSYAFTVSYFWMNATRCLRHVSWHRWNTCRSTEWLETASTATAAACGPLGELSRHCCCCRRPEITLCSCFPSSPQHACLPRGTPRAAFKKSWGTRTWEQGKHIWGEAVKRQEGRSCGHKVSQLTPESVPQTDGETV